MDFVARGIYLVEKINQVSINPTESADPAYEIQQFEEIIQRLEKGGIFSTQNGAVVSIERRGEIDPFVTQIRDFWDTYLRALNQLDQSAPLTEENEQAENTLLLEGNALIAAIYELLEFLEEHSTVHHNRLILLNVLFLGLSVPILALSFYLINNRISKPLENLTRAAQQYQKGNFEQTYITSGDDEISHLGQAFEEMKSEIQAHQSTLEKEISDRLQEISTAFEFSQDIVSQLELQQLLSSATEKVKQLLQAKAVNICLVNSQNNTLSQVASTNQIVGDRYSTQSMDIRNPFIWTEQNNTIVEQVRLGGCEFLNHASASNRCFATPLRVGQDIIGEMGIFRDEDTALSDNEKRALLLLANSIAVAIQNAMLTQQSQQQTRETAKLGERERLASDLHDNLAQTLNTLNLQTEELTKNLSTTQDSPVPEEIKEIRQNLNVALEQVKMAISGYNTSLNQGNGNYWQEIQQYLDKFSQEIDIQINLPDNEPIFSSLSGIVQKQIVFILRESLTNINKHAQATTVEITFQESVSGVDLKISDNGIGFDPEEKRGDHHLGLQIMKARAERTGGALVIQSEIGKGTIILAHFPCEPDMNARNEIL
jgi:two-component system nitrate/nitrite sensor histidine kinase NarX